MSSYSLAAAAVLVTLLQLFFGCSKEEKPKQWVVVAAAAPKTKSIAPREALKFLEWIPSQLSQSATGAECRTVPWAAGPECVKNFSEGDQLFEANFSEQNPRAIKFGITGLVLDFGCDALPNARRLKTFSRGDRWHYESCVFTGGKLGGMYARIDVLPSLTYAKQTTVNLWVASKDYLAHDPAFLPRQQQ